MTRRMLPLFISAASIAPAMAADDLEALRQQLATQQSQIETLADQLEQMQAGGGGGRWYDATTLGGYAEAYYKRIDGLTDETDAYRLVLFLGHQFNDKLRFGSELEIEHAYVKDTDTSCTVTDSDASGDLQASEIVCGKPATTQGYLAVEQLFLEYQYLKNHRVSAGQLLVPVGIVNETHEPETFHGVFRPPVEREIIPSTWFETGVMASGLVAPGVSYDALFSSGMKNAEGKIKDGRQRGSKANASDLASTLRVKYTAIPGVEMGATVHRQPDMSQGSPGVAGEDLGGLLKTAHVVWQYGSLGLRSLVARWDLDDEALTAANDKRSEQSGWYVEPSWKLTPTLSVFSRYSEWDNEKADNVDSEWQEHSVGVNWYLDPRAVVKADLQRRDDPVAGNTDQNGFNLGIGFSF